MTKLLAMPQNTDISKYNTYVDGYLFGLKDYAVNMPIEISIDEIKELDKQCLENNKELFICINKNIYSEELEHLKGLLLEIDKLHIKALFFADTAIINMKENLNLKIDLVWSQEHLTTNYATINNWMNFGVKYTYLSSDITLREIKQISENTKSILIVPIFGYIPIFTSKRHQIRNYLDKFKLDDDSRINYIEKEGLIYPIVDNKEGTVVYSSHILNGYKEYRELEVDYVTLNSFNIDEEVFIEVLKVFKEKKLDTLELENSDTGFLHKEMIYKVK